VSGRRTGRFSGIAIVQGGRRNLAAARAPRWRQAAASTGPGGLLRIASAPALAGLEEVVTGRITTLKIKSGSRAHKPPPHRRLVLGVRENSRGANKQPEAPAAEDIEMCGTIYPACSWQQLRVRSDVQVRLLFGLDAPR
jgi:hypothetical protein